MLPFPFTRSAFSWWTVWHLKRTQALIESNFLTKVCTTMRIRLDLIHHKRIQLLPVKYSKFYSFDSNTMATGVAESQMELIKPSVITLVKNVDILHFHFYSNLLNFNISVTVVITVIWLHFRRVAQSHKIS